MRVFFLGTEPTPAWKGQLSNKRDAFVVAGGCIKPCKVPDAVVVGGCIEPCEAPDAVMVGKVGSI